jgi:hypothetical protein
MRRDHLNALFLNQIYLVLHSVLLFWKLLIFEFLLGKSEILLCSISSPQVIIVPLLDALQLIMLLTGTFK